MRKTVDPQIGPGKKKNSQLETSDVYQPHILDDIQSRMDSQNFVW